MSRGRPRSKFFDMIAESLRDIIKDYTDRGERVQQSGRVLKVTVPEARRRANSFRSCLAMDELVEEYGSIFHVSVPSDKQFNILFKEETSDADATLEVCGG
jgi:hypothetical protein